MTAPSVTFKYPKALDNSAGRIVLRSIGEFVRDLWLSKSPHVSGDYVRGLMRANSIRIGGGKIEVINHAKHADFYERGHRSFNLGMAMLNSGRKVKRAKDGSRYKIIKIDRSHHASFRKPSVAASALKAFGSTLRPSVRGYLARVSKPRAYRPRARLRQPLKPGASKAGPKGFFIVSEKAIRADPRKWLIPAMEGRGLAKQVQIDAQPLVDQAIAQAVERQQEKTRSVASRKPPGTSRVAKPAAGKRKA